ncbi:MAG: hypothetical protein KatS3mg082_3030 [Nitrospiraceae bacterium]|nr:MAG: hypothetical protein KatS3mg015_1228 [Fimbriimonadales bacterium]GIW56626.1 MAG: hypothetical protein KatS3mg082_3030 [Nitrospiraceae bacterium]
MREDDGGDAVLAQDAAPLGERRGHRLLEPLAIFDPAVVFLVLVLDRFALLRRERISSGSKGSRKSGWPGRARLSQTKKKSDRSAYGDGVVVGRVGEPDVRRLVGERVLGGVGRLDLAGARTGPGFDHLRDPVKGALVATR